MGCISIDAFGVMGYTLYSLGNSPPPGVFSIKSERFKGVGLPIHGVARGRRLYTFVRIHLFAPLDLRGKGMPLLTAIHLLTSRGCSDAVNKDAQERTAALARSAVRTRCGVGSVLMVDDGAPEPNRPYTYSMAYS